MFVQEKDAWKRAKVGRSADHGISWTFTDWIINEPNGAFVALGIIQFGKDYQDARDQFVYGYSSHQGYPDDNTDPLVNKGLDLLRVLKGQLINRRAYEFLRALIAMVMLFGRLISISSRRFLVI